MNEANWDDWDEILVPLQRSADRPEKGEWTCKGCTGRFTGLAASHCGQCHQTFTRVSVFDMHRVIDKRPGHLHLGDWAGKRCLTVEELHALRKPNSTDPMFIQNDRGYWQVYWDPDSPRPWDRDD